MIDGVFKVKEFAFNAAILKQLMVDRVQNCGVDLLFDHRVTTIRKDTTDAMLHLYVTSDVEPLHVHSQHVFNCTYSLLNSILNASQIELIPLRHEMTELCLVDVPDVLKNVGITVMCGPFFPSCPFPPGTFIPLVMFVTPHYEWDDNNQSSYFDAHQHYQHSLRNSAWRKCKWMPSVISPF
ncbi:hypothetical protein P4S72_29830 [Vibrio sp. PP-XX7]